MSSSLVWEPANRKTHDLPYALKNALQKRYDYPINTIMDSSNIEYLQGLADAGVEGSDKLIEAIEKHDRISVKEVW